jgi:hypothetical protein
MLHFFGCCGFESHASSAAQVTIYKKWLTYILPDSDLSTEFFNPTPAIIDNLCWLSNN